MGDVPRWYHKKPQRRRYFDQGIPEKPMGLREAAAGVEGDPARRFARWASQIAEEMEDQPKPKKKRPPSILGG